MNLCVLSQRTNLPMDDRGDDAWQGKTINTLSFSIELCFREVNTDSQKLSNSFRYHAFFIYVYSFLTQN